MIDASSRVQQPQISPQEVLNLQNRLLEQRNLKAQTEYLKGFLREQFGGEIYLTFDPPPKPHPVEPILGDPPLPIPYEGRLVQHQEQERSFWTLVPLAAGRQEIGHITLHRPTPLSPSALETLSLVGQVAGVALNATIQTNLQTWRQKQLALVRSVTAQVSQFTDLDLLAQRITALVQETFDYYYVAVFLIHKETGRLHFKASAGADDCDRPVFENPSHPGFALGEHIIGYVAQTGQELIANDVANEPRYQSVDSLQGTRSEAVLPLSVLAENLGVFDVQSDQIAAFDDNDLLVLRALADSIALSIQSARLLSDVQRQADQLSAVAEASAAITSILDTDELLEKIVQLIHRRFGFPYVHLYQVDMVHSRIIFKAGSGKRTPQFAQAGVWFDLTAEKGVIARVAQSGKTMRVDDVSVEPLYLKTPFSEIATGSEMTVPLTFGNEVLGVLDIQSDETHAFTLEDQQLIETFADNIAIAIRNARLYRSEIWRRQVAESLRDIAGLLSDNATLDNTLNAILVELQRNLPCDIGAIWLFDPESPSDLPVQDRTLRLTACQTTADYDSSILSNLTFVPDDWVRQALAQKQPTIRQKDDPIGPIGRLFGLDQSYSAIAAPMHAGDEILGMLTLIHPTPNRYGLESQKITSAFSSYAAIAVENTRLYTTSQEQAYIATILLEVAQATQTQTNLQELVQTIVRLTPMVVGIKGCALFLRDAENEIYALYAIYGIGEADETINLNQPLPTPDAPLLAELTLAQEMLLVQDPEEDLGLPADLAQKMKQDSLLLMPLQARDEVLGALLLVNESDPDGGSGDWDAFSEERLNLIQGVIQQTAIAVENIRLLESRQEEAYISTVLLQAAQAGVTSANLDDTLESIVGLLPILVGIDSSVIYLYNEGTEEFVAAHATLPTAQDENALIGTAYSPGDFSLLDAVYQTNRPLVHPMAETVFPAEDWDLALPDEEQIDPTPILQSRYPLLMAFPLSIKDEVFGVFVAQDNNYALNRRRRFELIWGIAQQASLAIQNDRLNKEMLDRQRLEREFQLAREIQQTFLPSEIPSSPGWEMDVRWEPARQVGGDFYDYFLLPDGRLALVIADVSNKGLAASLYMTVTRTLIRAAALETPSPARVLERVNDLLLMDSQNGLFVTAFYGALDLTTGRLTHASAGHNPPFLIHHQAATVTALERGGIALGAVGEIHLEDRALMLEPGDCLILYTDGVTEAFDLADHMYGEKRLKRVLYGAQGLTAHQVLTLLEADLQAFRGEAPLSDDTTILALCRSLSLANENGQRGTS